MRVRPNGASAGLGVIQVIPVIHNENPSFAGYWITWITWITFRRNT